MVSTLPKLFLSLVMVFLSGQGKQVVIREENHVITKMAQQMDPTDLHQKQQDLGKYFRTQIYQDQRNGIYSLMVFADMDLSIIFDDVLPETSRKLYQFQYEVKTNLEHQTAINIERNYSVAGSYRNEIIYIQAQGDTVTVVIAVEALEIDGGYRFYIALIISIAAIYASYNYYGESPNIKKLPDHARNNQMKDLTKDANAARNEESAEPEMEEKCAEPNEVCVYSDRNGYIKIYSVTLMRFM